MAHDLGHSFDPNPKLDVENLFRTAARVLALGLASIFCLVGLYLAVDLYGKVSTFIASPETLESALAAWEANPEHDAASAAHRAESESGEPFVRFLRGVARALSQGHLAKPMGGFVIFLLVLLLIRITMGVLGMGVKLLVVLNHPGIEPGGFSLVEKE